MTKIIVKKNLHKIKATTTKPLRQATLCFLVKGNYVLLAMKKRGFAEGKWNGVGGKRYVKDKSIKEAAIRETREEISVKLNSMRLVAVLNFYHLGNQKAGQQVAVYLSDKWEGKPQETEEMAPKWFDIKKIPYSKMWEDDKYWLPRILAGEQLVADFLFDDNQNLLEYDIRKVERFINRMKKYTTKK